MRRLLPAAILVAALGGAAAAHAIPAPTYRCSPGPSDCQGWYRSAVTITWDWDQHSYEPAGGTCLAPTTLTADTKGTWVTCSIRPRGQVSPVAGAAVLLHVDRTAPTVDSAAPSRPPDYQGWFNQPVTFTFGGSDATSGLASCEPAGFGGPDGAATVQGTCRDVAGNVGVRAFPLAYDATPPAKPEVTATPGDEVVALSWRARDAARTEIARVSKDGAAVVFNGRGRRFTDRRLRNQRRYRYVVTVLDRAGNRAQARIAAVPTASKLFAPARGERLRTPPLLRWKRTKGARYYNAQLFRGRRKVLTAWPRKPRLQLRSSWRFGGKRMRLRPGVYRWYVFPGFGRLSAQRYGRVLGTSTFRIVR